MREKKGSFFRRRKQQCNICHKQMATKPALEWYKEIRSHDKLLRLQRIRIFVFCQTETHRCISKSKDNHTHKSSIIQTSKSLKNQSCSKMFPLTHANAFPTNTTLIYMDKGSKNSSKV